MKLIICPVCLDAFRASFEHRICLCGRSFGHIQANGTDVETGGTAVVIELDGFTITQALIVHAPGAIISGYVLPS